MRKMLSALLLGAAAAVLLAGRSPAADLAKAPSAYQPAVFSWNGLFIGGFGLYGGNFTGTDISMLGTAANLGAIPHGPGLGGELGYYLDTGGPFVLGLQADIAYANLSDSGAVGSGVGALSFSNATNYLGGLSADIGVPLSSDRRLLGYAGAGFAFGGAKPNLNVGSVAVAAADTSTGWRAEAGLKYAIDPHWQIGMRGEYYQLGDRSLSIMDSSGNLIATSTAKYHILVQKVGFDYKF